MCAKCGAPEFSWERSSGKGTLFSWTVTHQALHPAFAAEIPFVAAVRSEEHTSELQSLMRISYAVFCLKKKNINTARHLIIILFYCIINPYIFYYYFHFFFIFYFFS